MGGPPGELEGQGEVEILTERERERDADKQTQGVNTLRRPLTDY